MQVAEVLSSERTVPVVATVLIHALFVYVIAISAGIIPKPGIQESTYVPVPMEKVEPIRETALIRDTETTTKPQFNFIAAEPILNIARDEKSEPPMGEETTKHVARPDGEGVLLPIVGARLLHKTEPLYPSYSRLRQEEGVVLLRIAITAAGTVASVFVERSSGFARLDEAATKAAREWRFSPAMQGSHAIATTTTVPVRFELH